MTNRRYLTLAVCVLGLCPRIALADVTITAVIQRPGAVSMAPKDANQWIIFQEFIADSPYLKIANGQTVPLKITTQGANERLEALWDDNLWDFARGRRLLLNHQTHIYRVEKIRKEDGVNPWLNAKIIDMHQWKRIAERRAHHYILRDLSESHSQADVWIVPGLESPAVLLPDLVSSDSPNLEAGIARLHGLCVQFDLHSAHDLPGGRLTYRVQSISTRPISSTNFALPKGYRQDVDPPISSPKESPQGGNIPIPPPKPQMQTELTNAASYGQIDSVEALLTMGRDINERDRAGNTPLLAAMSPKPMIGQTPDDVREPVAMVKLLLDHHADVNLPNSQDGATPLIDAAVGGYARVISLLLAHGADLHAKDKTGKTALDWALLLHRTQLAPLLTESAQDGFKK